MAGNFLSHAVTSGDFMAKDFMAGNILAGNFMAHRVIFGDFMVGNFLAGDFLGGYRHTHNIPLMSYLSYAVLQRIKKYKI